MPKALIAITAALTLSSQAAANESGRTSSLSWVRLPGAESCIATQALARSVEQRLGRKVFVSAAEADVSVEGYLSHDDGTWRAVLTIRDGDGKVLGTRTLESQEGECSALDDGVVFVVSVLIDPETTSAPAEPETRKPPPAPAPKPRVIVRRERVVVSKPAPREPWHVELGVAATGALGLLPQPAAGVGFSALLDPPRFWDIQISGAYWLSVTETAERGAKAKLSLYQGSVALCPISSKSRTLAYRACAGVVGGALHSQGQGFDSDLGDDAPSLYAALPNRLTVRLVGPLALTAEITPMAPLVRTKVTYREPLGSERTLFAPPVLAVAGAVGLAVLLPAR
ncbi:MAG: hypothetical protein KC776_26060 [Myxococcales bacterium]|nr:hypothetical protein [Myxococcales bacterium]